MMTWDVVRKQRLDIYHEAASEFEHAHALVQYRKQFVKIRFPVDSIPILDASVGVP